MQIDIRTILIDARLQCRAAVNKEVVEEYAASMKDGEKFPPLSLVRVDKATYLVDGFTRFHAYATIDMKKVDVKIVDGTWEDAVKAACGANALHGLRRSASDRRKAVEIAMKSFPKLSPTEVSKVCSVSRSFSYKVFEDVKVAQEKRAKAASKAAKEPEVVAVEPKPEATKKASRPKKAAADRLDVVPGLPCVKCSCMNWVLTNAGRACEECGLLQKDSIVEDVIAPIDSDDKKKIRKAYGTLIRVSETAKAYESLKDILEALGKRIDAL